MMSGLVRRPIKAHKGTIVDGQIVYDKEEDKVDTKILAEQTLQRDPIRKTKTVEPDEIVTETAPPPESFSPVAAAPVEATQVRSVDPAPTTTTVEPDEIATDTAPPPEQLSMAVSAADLSKTLQENFAREQQKSRQKTSDSKSKAFVGTSLEDLLNKDSSPEGITKRLEEAGVAKATASDINKAELQSMDQALAKSLLSSNAKLSRDAQKKLKEALLSNIYEREKQFKAESVGKQITKDIPSVYKATVKEQQELKRLGLILENDPTVKKHREIEKSINEIRNKELRPYDEKMQEAFKKFGRNSEQFKNAREAFEFQNRLVNKELLPLQKERYKLKNEIESSSAYLNLKQAEDLIYNRKQIRSDVANQFNKGGMSMEQQMSLFEEGGMKDDGLNRDPVSGNEIPPGSLAKEVRDDIPAQLSEGEYVVPADVVQYYGVKFFEELRAEAKRGLAEMEATGRIGGEPIEVDMTMIAFGQKDKDKKEKKATGGVVGFDNGGVSADVKEVEKSRTFNPADYSVLGFPPTNQSVNQSVINQDVFRTYYGPQNQTMKIPGRIDADGNWNANEGFEQFVVPPWTSVPKELKQKNRDKQKGSSNIQQQLNIDGWGLNPSTYNFNTWSKERFLKEAENQLKVSPSERFIIGFSSMVNPFAGLAVRGLATGDGIAKTTVLVNMAKKAGDNETANAMEVMIKKAKDSAKGFQGWLLNSSFGNKTTNAYVTLLENQMSKTNSTFSNFVNDNSLRSLYSGPSEPLPPMQGPQLPPMQGPMPQQQQTTTASGTVLATPDTNPEDVANFGGRDVDQPATLANFGFGDNNESKNNTGVTDVDRQKEADDFTARQIEKFKSGEKVSGFKKGGLATRTKKRRKK